MAGKFKVCFIVFSETFGFLVKRKDEVRFIYLCNHLTDPDVQLWTLILLALEDLWSSIRRAAAPCGQRLPGLEEVPKSKIYKGKDSSGVVGLGCEENYTFISNM